MMSSQKAVGINKLTFYGKYLQNFKGSFFQISKQYGKPFRGSQYESTLLSGYIDSFQSLIQPTAKFQF